MKKFIKALHKKKYSYEYNEGKIIVTHNGHVILHGIESLPEYTTFKNSGGVYLRDLKSLSEYTTFENVGFVDLPSVESLPKNITFKNGSGVYLHDLKSLPEAVRFDNGGHVFLDSMNNKTIDYNNRTLDIIIVDGWTMIIKEKQTKGDFSLYAALYLVGTYNANNPKCTIVEKDGDFVIVSH